MLRYDAHTTLVARRTFSNINSGPVFPHIITHGTAMAPPSSCLISGIFTLSDGSRNSDLQYYTTYLSALDFVDPDKFLNISIRKYTAPADALYADGTFVYVVAKAALPGGDDGMLDPIHCTPFQFPLGDNIPPDPTHVAFITGTINSTSDNGSVRSFTLAVSEYVRDERRHFSVRFVPHSNQSSDLC